MTLIADAGGLSTQTIVKDLSGGAVSGFVAITYASSYAALLFSGALEPYLAYGLGVTLLTVAVGGVIASLTTSLRFSIGGPDSNTTSILAVLLSGLAAAMVQGQSPAAADTLLPTILFTVFVSTLVTGGVLYLLGAFRMGRWVRFIPYPVMGGFLAATGWLMASGALGVIADLSLTVAGLRRVLEGGADLRLPVGIALAVGFLILLRRARNPLVQPLLVTVSSAAVFLGLWVFDVDWTSAQQDGWLFQGIGEIRFLSPYEVLWTGGIRYELGAVYIGDLFAIVFVAIITLLLCATALEVATGEDVDLDRELRAYGLTNLTTASVGGYLSLLSPARSLIIYRSGGRSRLGGLIAAAMGFVVLFGSPDVIEFLPKIVLGAFLLYLGLSFLYEWLVESWVKFQFWEYVLVVAIFVLTVQFGFTVGVFVGVVGACLDFAVNYSRLNVVKNHFSGLSVRSRFERPAEERQVLDSHGDGIVGFAFHGFLFFGMASPLLDRIRVSIRETPTLRFLLLDFTDVHGVDSSAAMVFAKLRQNAASAGVVIVYIGIGSRVAKVFKSAGTLVGDDREAVFPNLDSALEWAEDRVVEAFLPQMDYQLSVLDDWLLDELGDGIAVECLKTYLHRIYLDEGDYLFRQGGRSDTLYLIDSGRVAILTNEASGQPRRIVSLLGGTAFGGEDFYESGGRSTSAQAELPCVVYGLTADRLQRLNSEYPHIATRFHGILLRLMARRLRMAQEEISLLRREPRAPKALAA